MPIVVFMDVQPVNVFAKASNMCANKVSFKTFYSLSVGLSYTNFLSYLFANEFHYLYYSEANNIKIMQFIYP